MARMTRNARGLEVRRLGRMGIGAILAVVLALGLFGPSGPTRAAAQDASNQISQFANVALPDDLGQAGIQAFVPATKHSVRGYMLDYWRANGASSVYGNPISEPFASADGFYSQAFENGIFQYHPELVWTDAPSISLMPIGPTALTNRLDTFNRDGRRGGGGGDRRTSPWKALDPVSRAAQRAVNGGGIYDQITAHTITGDFLTWYNSHEGAGYLGSPISQQVSERGVTVQYFQGALLIRTGDGQVSLAPLAKEMTPRLGIDTKPVAQGDLPVYDETMFWTMDNPNPQGADPRAAGRKWIEVSLSQQTLWAYQGNTLVTTTLVSTGLAPNDTKQGVTHVRYKLPVTDMAGTIDGNGQVVALGQAAADAANKGQVAGQAGYVVKDVPDVMYFNSEAAALHGAYWHNNFGNPMSHGCVNLPLDMAHFLFGWAPLGTMVWVRQ